MTEAALPLWRQTAATVQPTSPLPCHTDVEWADYTASLAYERSVHYAPSKMRRTFGVTDVMVSACLDCQPEFQRDALVRGLCRPPAHSRPITPLERLDAGQEDV
jgi:hypothetical protein